jgi:hypothetical protein
VERRADLGEFIGDVDLVLSHEFVELFFAMNYLLQPANAIIACQLVKSLRLVQEIIGSFTAVVLSLFKFLDAGDQFVLQFLKVISSCHA